MIADLAIATVAAMVPPNTFDIRLCDENITPVDFDCGADIVAITGKVSQWGRMKAIAEEFRRRGTTVVIGGPYTSLCPDVVAPHCDVMVQGEIEEVAAEIFSDLYGGRFKDHYRGTQPDLAISPPGRWDLYPNHAAKTGCVQTSRGCPFECDFCDVIQYLGRKQRHKPVANVLRELEEQYDLGYRTVFLADDNFTAYRKRAKELLAALRDWNRKREKGKMTFATQISIDSAKDDEMLQLLAEAGVSRLFIGIETPNEESLRESKKRQNLGVSLIDQVQRYYDHGLMVIGGMIVGFDNDGPDIFERQFEFITQAAIPIASLGALVAPAATPLHERMEREGRLVAGSEQAATPWSTNIVPKRLTPDQLLDGIKWLANKIYSPAEFGERIVQFVDKLGPRHDPRSRDPWYSRNEQRRQVDRDSGKLITGIPWMGVEETKMVARVTRAVLKKPAAFEFAASMLLQYCQVRYMYEKGHFWEAQLADQIAPVLEPSALPLAS